MFTVYRINISGFHKIPLRSGINMEKHSPELDKALDIQTKAYTALNEIIMTIINTEANSFPNYPFMVPTLCLAALCQYINSYIGTFPDNMKENIISMAYNTIGFTSLDDPNDLASMEIAGNA